MEEKIDCPKYPNVFKFYSLTNYNVDAFVNHYLYLNHPGELNDLMDTKLYTLDMRGTNPKQFELFRQEILSQNPLMENLTYVDKVDVQCRDGLYALQKYIFDCFFAFGGLVSLASKDRFNELMWSHYTKESGFMIEFTCDLLDDIKAIDKNKRFKNIIFHPIQYRKHPMGIRCSENPYEQKSICEINKSNAYQKYEGWSYENEWRIVAISQQYLGDYNYYSSKQSDEFNLRKLYYSTNSIARIYLGKRVWTYDNFVVKDEQIDRDNKIRKYTLQEPCVCCEKKRFYLFLQFIQKLRELQDKGIIIISFIYLVLVIAGNLDLEPIIALRIIRSILTIII